MRTAVPGGAFDSGGRGLDDVLQLVIFSLDAQRYALPLAQVQRVVPAAEVTPVPAAPAIVLGAIDIQGQIVPVLDLRRHLGLPARDLRLSDQFIIASTPSRMLALWVDDTQGLVECPASEMTQAQALAPELPEYQGLVRLADGLVLIHRLDAFVFPEEMFARPAACEEPA